jgi:hypothetical protein
MYSLKVSVPPPPHQRKNSACAPCSSHSGQACYTIMNHVEHHLLCASFAAEVAAAGA